MKILIIGFIALCVASIISLTLHEGPIDKSVAIMWTISSMFFALGALRDEK